MSSLPTEMKHLTRPTFRINAQIPQRYCLSLNRLREPGITSSYQNDNSDVSDTSILVGGERAFRMLKKSRKMYLYIYIKYTHNHISSSLIKGKSAMI